MVLFCCFGSLVTPCSLEKGAGGVVERAWWFVSQFDRSPESRLSVWSCYGSVEYDIYCPLFYWKLFLALLGGHKKYTTTTFNLEFNYLHTLLWHTKYAGIRSKEGRFINSVKYLPTRFNPTQPGVGCVMIKTQSRLFVFYLGAFWFSVLKRPRLLQPGFYVLLYCGSENRKENCSPFYLAGFLWDGPLVRI